MGDQPGDQVVARRTGDRILARGVDLGDGDDVGFVEAGAEILEKVRKPRIAMGLVDGDRFAGWVAADDVRALGADPGATLDALTPLPPAAQVAPASSLREALEVILTARSANAVVRNDDGTFGGILSLEHIREGLAR